jgi:hypothetical protein
MSLAYIGTLGRGKVTLPPATCLSFKANKMAGVIETYSKSEVRMVVRFFFFKQKE